MALPYALVTTTQVEAQLGGSFTAGETTIIESMIDSATMFAEKYIGRFIKGRGSDTTEVQDVVDTTQEIFVRNFPIISLTSVTENGETITLTDIYQYNDIGRLSIKSGNWLKGRQIVSIDYQGGYATVPEDLQQWAIDIVGVMYQNRNSKNVKQESVGTISVTYVTDIVKDNAYLQLVLDQYKSNYIASWA